MGMDGACLPTPARVAQPFPGSSKTVVGLGSSGWSVVESWLMQEQPSPLQIFLLYFFAAIGPSLLSQDHRLHHPLLPVGQGDPAGAAGMTREPSTGRSSPSPWPIYAPPFWLNPALSHPVETAAPMGSHHPHQGKAPSSQEKPLLGVWGGSGVKPLLDGSTRTSPVPSSPPSLAAGEAQWEPTSGHVAITPVP